MGRSIKKGPYVDANVESKVLAINDGSAKKGVIKTGVVEVRLPRIL